MLDVRLVLRSVLCAGKGKGIVAGFEWCNKIFSRCVSSLNMIHYATTGKQVRCNRRFTDDSRTFKK